MPFTLNLWYWQTIPALLHINLEYGYKSVTTFVREQVSFYFRGGRKTMVETRCQLYGLIITTLTVRNSNATSSKAKYEQ